MKQPLKSQHFRHDIQGLRGIAVLAVVMYHAGIPFFDGGFVGVDVFFVVSGYLITGILSRELERTHTIGFLNFYARRIRRLLPAAVIVLLATAFAVTRLLSPIEQSELLWTFLTTALYTSNFWFARTELDYLGADLHQNPLLHTWSLGVEEQFYLVWPALMLLGALTIKTRPIRIRLIVVCLIVLVPSLLASLSLTSIAQPWAFFSSPTRAWQFAVGGLGYLIGSKSINSSRYGANALFALGIALIIASVLSFDNRTPFPGFSAIVPTLGTVLVLMACVERQVYLSRFLSFAPIQLMGYLSYSWYLWHWPLQIFWLHWFQPKSLVEQLMAPFLSLILAWLTFVLVENRFRYSAIVSASSLRTFVAGIVLTTIALGAVVGLKSSVDDLATDSRQALVNTARAERPRIYADGCHLAYSEVDFGGCTYGNPDGDTEIVLFGDSHAAHWFPALNKLAKERGQKLTSLTKSSCPSYVVSTRNEVLGRTYHECDEWRSKVFAYLAESRPAMVFVSNYNSDWHIDVESEVSADWQTGMFRLLEELSDSAEAVFVIRDIASPDFDMPICLSRAAVRGRDWSSCNFSDGTNHDKIVDSFIRNAASKYNNVFWIDAGPVLCDGTACRAVIDQEIVFRDSHHLTVRMSAALSSIIGVQVTESLRSIEP